MRKPLTLAMSLLCFASQPVLAAPLAYIGQMKVVKAQYEDTLIHIGRANNLGFLDMRAANPKLDAWIPGEGAKVVLPTMMLLPTEAPQKGIVINLPEMRLYYYPKAGAKPLTYSIGIGREGLSTPTGSTTVVRKTVGPTWRPTDRMRKEDPTLPPAVGPGPDNPMGTHAMYLGFPQIAIHGTDKPYGIGRRLSSGCIRMYPEGVVELFKSVSVGTPVTVIDQPVKVAWIGNNLYMEAHPTQKDALIIERDGGMPSYDMSDKDMSDILRTAGADMEENIDWAKVRQAIKERRGYPVMIGSRPGTHDANIAMPVEIESTGIKGQPVQTAMEKAKDAPVVAVTTVTTTTVTTPTPVRPVPVYQHVAKTPQAAAQTEAKPVTKAKTADKATDKAENAAEKEPAGGTPVLIPNGANG